MCVLSHSVLPPWTVAHQAPLSMGFSRQESWSGQPFPSSGNLPDPGMEPMPPALQADSLPSEPPGKSNKLALETVLLKEAEAWGGVGGGKAELCTGALGLAEWQ